MLNTMAWKKFEVTVILVAEMNGQYRKIHIDCIHILINIKMNLGPPSGQKSINQKQILIV